VLLRLIQTVHEDPIDQTAYTAELETENETLRCKLEALERELQCRSPTKSPKKAKVPSLNLSDIRVAAGSDSGNEALACAFQKLNGLGLTEPAECRSPGKTPGKKIRKLTARRWDLMDENEMDAFENY
jgi:hypothetical protein